MTGWHLIRRAGLICLIYLLFAVAFFVVTLPSGIPIDVTAAIVFPLYLPFGADFTVQIIRNSFVSGIYVFLFYLVLEWLVATALLSGALWLRGRHVTSGRESTHE